MNLNIYDQDMNRISIIGNRYVSCLWEEGYNTVQKFTLELQETEEFRKKIRPDFYVGRNDRKTMMVIKTVQIKYGKIIASGSQATRVLDDVNFVGTIKADSVISDSIKGAYDSSNGYRAVEFAEGNLPDSYDSQISNKSILGLCETMCQSVDVGFRSVRGSGKIFIELYKPEENPNLIYSEKYGNLIVDSITLSTEKQKNYAVVLGAGEGANRTRVDVDVTNGEDRREIIVDAKDLQVEDGETDSEYRARLYARGLEKLLENQRTWECAFTPISKDFGSRFDLGDVLTVSLPEYNLKLKARVSKFSQKAQQNKVNTTIEVGDITITR